MTRLLETVVLSMVYEDVAVQSILTRQHLHRLKDRKIQVPRSLLLWIDSSHHIGSILNSLAKQQQFCQGSSAVDEQIRKGFCE